MDDTLDSPLLAPSSYTTSVANPAPLSTDNGSGFSTDLNSDYHTSTFDQQAISTGDVLGKVAGLAISSVVDAGASLWNSLPGTTNVDTGDLLKNINQDALQVYNENPDLVHAISFIGGAIAPSGLALKGMNALREGMEGISWFSNAGKAAQLSKINTLVEGAGQATTEYRTAVRGMYARGLANQALDAVAMEGALVLSYNAHPLMEDYMADPVKNFALSAAFGGVIGGAVGAAGDMFSLKALVGNTWKTAIDNTIGTLRPITQDMTSAVALQSHDVNLKNLDNMLDIKAAAGKTPDNDLEASLLAKARFYSIEKSNELWDNIVTPQVASLPIETQNDLKQIMLDKPEMAGVEKVGTVTDSMMADRAVLNAPANPLNTIQPTLEETVGTGATAVTQPVKAVYFQNIDKYGSLGDVVHYGDLSALNTTADDLVSTLPKSYGKIPNFDSSLELVGKSAPNAEGEYAAALLKVASATPEDLGKMLVATTDGPTLNAVVARLKADPDLAMKLTIKTTDSTPTFGAIMKEQGNNVSLAKGIPIDYAKELKTRFQTPIFNREYDMLNPKTVASLGQRGLRSPQATDMLESWRGGNSLPLKRAVTEWLSTKGGMFGASRTDGTLVNHVNELYHSPQSIGLRNELSKIADADGKVLLYRGTSVRDLKQSSAVESYTTDFNKAASFAGGGKGTVHVHKIDVEDILGGIEDIGTKGPDYNNNEILVMSSARPAEAQLSPAGNLIFKKAQNEVQSATIPNKGMYLPDLIDQLAEYKQGAIDSLIARGIPLESIAIKTNTPQDIVDFYAANKGNITLQEAGEFTQQPISKFNSVADVNAALDPAKQPLVLSGNPAKNKGYTSAHASLDNKTMASINKEATAALLYGSGSQTAVEMGDFVFGVMNNAIDVLKTELGKANNMLAGNTFINSFDFFARNMGSVGPIVSAIGKEVQQVANRAVNRIVSPVKTAMAAVAKDEAALVEWNTFKVINDSIPGYRKFEDGQLLQRVERPDASGKMVHVFEPVQFQGKSFSIKSQSVIDLVNEIQNESPELRNLANANKKITGSPDVNDIGLWIPSFNPVNKFIAYVHDTAADTTQLLIAKTKEEYADLVKSYQKYLNESGQNTAIQIVEKDQQAMWSRLNGRLDTVHMKQADTGLLKTGSGASAIVPSGLASLSEVAGGYEHYIQSQVRNMADLSMPEVTDQLSRISAINNAATHGQTFDKIKDVLTQPKDAAAAIKNVLLGSNNLGQYGGWQTINRSFETYLTMGLNAVGDAWNSTVTPLTKGFFGKNKNLTPEMMQKMDYEKMSNMLASKGITNPWSVYDDEAAKMFGISKLTESPDTSKRIIYASNALAANLALRIGDLAQPLVNMLSLPVLTGLAIGSRMPENFMGVAKGTAKVGGVQIMYEGARAANSPLWQRFDAVWEKAGYYQPLVSEVTNVMRASRSFERGLIPSIENAMDSTFVKVMSKPADLSESWVRRQTMYTGAVLAKRLYPELDDTGITLFARDFMDKAVGNYHATQRPVFFQGTLGVALGLFQTYMLTLGQSIYRQVETKNWATLGKAALTQNALFGTASMPGFDMVSNAIGDHFSNEHVDLTTGSYRALGDKAASFLLYGLPSNMGPSVYTRGDVSVRPPNILGGFQNTVAVSFVKQTMDMMGNVANSLQSSSPDIARSLLESLSMQSMSRPIARGAEILTGYSVDRNNKTVSAPDETWTPTGIISRVLATRPIEETKLRTAMHLNSYYGATDRANRQAVVSKLSTAIRNETLTDDQMSQFADEYMKKNGTPTGWRAALNNALAITETGGKETFANKLKPDSALNFMMNNLDGG